MKKYRFTVASGGRHVASGLLWERGVPFSGSLSLMDAPPTGYLKFKPSINQSAALDFRLGGAICLLFVTAD
ncbi:hypothetical protein [Eikenella halliae]|uniref:hypothetical protein n=1 Tax=Eikenella halliae TaxID=1795832 RepID=UPI003615AE98